MELKERFFIIKKRAVLIILLTFTFTLISAILNFYVFKSTYNADISVIIGKTESVNKDSGSEYYDIIMYQTMVKTYSKLAMSRTVAKDVLEMLNIQSLTEEDLLNSVEVTPDKDTQFLTISATSNNPMEAMNIANQFAKSLKSVSLKVYNVDNVKLLEVAQLPVKPSSPKPIRNIALTFFIGILFSIGLTFLLEYLDNTIKTKEDVEEMGLYVIGTISLVKIPDKDVIIC